jgi:hypothetical protein
MATSKRDLNKQQRNGITSASTRDKGSVSDELRVGALNKFLCKIRGQCG